MAVVTGRGDREVEGLKPRDAGIAERVPQFSGPLGVQLVEQDGVGVETFLGRGIGREGPVHGPAAMVDNPLRAADYGQLPQEFGRGLDHVGRLGVHDPRLVAVDGDFGTVQLKPDKEDVEAFLARRSHQQARRKALDAQARLPSVTPDGVAFKVQVNIESLRDFDTFEVATTDGIGLLLFPILAGLVIVYILTGVIGAGTVITKVTEGTFPRLFESDKGAVPYWLSTAVVSGVVLLYVLWAGVRAAVGLVLAVMRKPVWRPKGLLF